MFCKPNRDGNEDRKLQIAIKKTITPYFSDKKEVLLREARSQLLIALSKYKAVRLEDGDRSKFCYPSYPSERQTNLSDIVGDGNISRL